MRRIRNFMTGVALPAVLISAGVVSFTVGCTREVYLPVESVRIDTLYNSRERIDSVVDRDSIYFAVKGDTVVREVYRLRTRTRSRVDTVYRVKSDTVRITVREPAANSRDGSILSGFIRMPEILKWFCPAAMLAVVACVGCKLYRRLKF